MRLYTAAEARELDRWAIQDLGIPEAALMEAAGLNVVMAMERQFGALEGRAVGVACGKGNNAGDALVAARHLANQGCRVTLGLAYANDQLSPMAAAHLKACAAMGLPALREAAAAFQAFCHCDLLIDGLLGTGSRGAAAAELHPWIAALNGAGRPVVAVDIPSGLDPDTGTFKGPHVDAALTVAFATVKRGQAIHPGWQACGKLVCVDIGIPHPGSSQSPSPKAGVSAPKLSPEGAWHMLDARDMAGLVPCRSLDAHKRRCGPLLVVAGSAAYTGAAFLASLSGMKAGSGMLYAAVPQSAAELIRVRLPEAIVLPLGRGKAYLGMEEVPAILELAKNCRAAVVGPGLGRHADTMDMVRELYRILELPAVFDADALFALQGEPLLTAMPRVLTPHSGEMGRLMGVTAGDVEADRAAAVLGQAQARQAVVVLKGPRSLVAPPGGGLAICPTGGPALATAGTGDVLAGLAGSLMAQGLSALDAAALAVYTHGMAVDALASEGAPHGLLASELCMALPRALKQASAG